MDIDDPQRNGMKGIQKISEETHAVQLIRVNDRYFKIKISGYPRGI